LHSRFQSGAKPVWIGRHITSVLFSVSNPYSNCPGGAGHLKGESDKIITGAFIILYAQSK